MSLNELQPADNSWRNIASALNKCWEKHDLNTQTSIKHRSKLIRAWNC